METGRNDPCPCGSGNKFKRCCGAPKSDPTALAAGVRRMAQETAEKHVRRVIREELGPDALDDAWDEFDTTEAGLECDVDEASLFVPWTLYDWEPFDSSDKTRPGDLRLTPVWLLVAKEGDRLSDAELQFLARVTSAPTSFHDVVSREPGRSLTLRDIFLGTEVTVFEKSGSSGLQPGDILYGRVVEFDDVALIIGSGELVIAPRYKGLILDAKAAIRKRHRRLTAERLCYEEPYLRDVYFQIRDAIVHPQRPAMSNTDGDPMEFHTLHYRIDDAEAAHLALSPLASGDSRDALLGDAKRDRRGALRRVTFPWTRAGNAKHGGMVSTTLADFTIDGKALSVEVNSAKRATDVRREIDKRLGTHATFVRDDVRSLDDARAEAKAKPDSRKDRAARREQKELQAMPEIQALIANMNADHYATWPDVPLPALKGKTPRQAMKTSDGRERVVALITDFERTQDAGRSKMPRYDFNLLRDSLGLPRR